MKNRLFNAICVCLMLCVISAKGQTQNIPVNEPNLNKPLLFSSLPDTIPVKIDNLKALLYASQGTIVDVGMSDNVNFQFKGEISSINNDNRDSQQTYVVRSSNYPGATLTFSKLINKNDNSFSLTGRIISMQHGDLFELVNENGQYNLIKRKFYDLINE
jgi:hypothetical protein